MAVRDHNVEFKSNLWIGALFVRLALLFESVLSIFITILRNIFHKTIID